MKTLTLRGTEEQFDNLSIAISHYSMPQEVETRVYVVDATEHNTSTLSDEMFMTLAEGLGTVYSLTGFQEAFNYGDVNTFTDIVRIINVKI